MADRDRRSKNMDDFRETRRKRSSSGEEHLYDGIKTSGSDSDSAASPWDIMAPFPTLIRASVLQVGRIISFSDLELLEVGRWRRSLMRRRRSGR